MPASQACTSTHCGVDIPWQGLSGACKISIMLNIQTESKVPMSMCRCAQPCTSAMPNLLLSSPASSSAYAPSGPPLVGSSWCISACAYASLILCFQVEMTRQDVKVLILQGADRACLVQMRTSLIWHGGAQQCACCVSCTAWDCTMSALACWRL